MQHLVHLQPHDLVRAKLRDELRIVVKIVEVLVFLSVVLDGSSLNLGVVVNALEPQMREEVSEKWVVEQSCTRALIILSSGESSFISKHLLESTKASERIQASVSARQTVRHLR